MSKTSDFFFSEDITYCMDGECLRTECIRHRSRAPIGVPLSWAWMRDQEGCLETAQSDVPDINDGDMISRQDAIEEIARWIGYIDEDMILRIQTGLKKLPSAQRWIPIKTRPMDEEERAEWSEKFGYDLENDEAVIYTSQLPDDGQEVITCSRYGAVRIDTFENDPDYGCSFEENGDMEGIVAWMPLPEPWKGEEDE